MTETEKGGGGVQTIGKIDVEKYRVVSEHIRTDEVVITDERIQHIKNSVITFLEISERKFQKYLRNKKILYKSE